MRRRPPRTTRTDTLVPYTPLVRSTDDGAREIAATMFLVDLPDPAIRIARIPPTIDSLMPGGHAIVTIDALRVPVANILGEPHAGFKSALVRLSPARLSHCMRSFGCALRAHAISTEGRRAGTQCGSSGGFSVT